MRKLILISVAAMLWSGAAAAEAVKSQFTASNGVIVTLYSDDFADRFEYTAPSVDLPGLGGFALVAKVRTAGKSEPAYVTGSVHYRVNGDFMDRQFYVAGRRWKRNLAIETSGVARVHDMAADAR